MKTNGPDTSARSLLRYRHLHYCYQREAKLHANACRRPRVRWRLPARVCAAGLRTAREYHLTGRGQAATFFNETSKNALLIGHELAAKPERVVSARISIGLSSSVTLLRAGHRLRRKQEPCCGEAEQSGSRRNCGSDEIPVIVRHGRRRCARAGGSRRTG